LAETIFKARQSFQQKNYILIASWNLTAALLFYSALSDPATWHSTVNQNGNTCRFIKTTGLENVEWMAEKSI
jgi:hypothetical protein